MLVGGPLGGGGGGRGQIHIMEHQTITWHLIALFCHPNLTTNQQHAQHWFTQHVQRPRNIRIEQRLQTLQNLSCSHDN